MPPWWESILGLKVDAVTGKQVSLEWTETSGVSGNGGTTLEFLSPFLRPPERVPEVPVVSREHLPQLEKIQEVLPSRRDEAQFR